MEELRRWYAVRTHPRKEFFAKQNFENQSFRVFLPSTIRIVRHARKVKETLSPLFPGYLFLHLAKSEENWITISSTRGAIGPVRFGNYYPPVPDWFIEGLMERANEKGIIPVGMKEKYGFSPGDKVRFKGPNDTIIEGVLKALDGKDRAIILIEMLKREVEAKVPLLNLRAA